MTPPPARETNPAVFLAAKMSTPLTRPLIRKFSLRIFVRSGQPANQLKAQPLASEIKGVYAGAAIA